MAQFLHFPRDRRGFALVLSLTIMALLVLVVLTAAGFLNLESRIADLAVRGAMARHNSLMSARLALAQLQLLAGPDQRVTATAGIIDTANTTWGPAPTNPNYALLTGVWHAGPKADSKTPARVLAPLQRSSNGYLYDTRFSDDASSPPTSGSSADGKTYDWANDRERTTSESRLLGWLVSGNEGLPLSAANYTGPRSAWTVGVTTRVPLLGSGTIPAASTEGTLAAPTGRVELPPVLLPGPSGVAAATGRYAWWVADEGVKARVNLPDPYAALQPDATNVGAGGYYRLMVAQRNNFALVKDGANTPFANWDAVSSTAASLAATSSFSQLNLLASTLNGAAYDYRTFYHDISFASLGLHTDTQRGGLKRDLSAYLNLGGASPTALGTTSLAYSAANPVGYVAWSSSYASSASFDAAKPVALLGVADTTDILGDQPWVPYGSSAALNVWGNGAGVSTSPKYGLIRSWYMQRAAWGASVAASLPVQRTSATAATAYSASNEQNYMVGSIKNQHKTAVHPVLSQFNVFFRPAYDSTVGGTVRAYMLVYPRVVLWNPWNVPISSQAYVVDVGHRFSLRAAVSFTTNNAAPNTGSMYFRYGNGVSGNYETSANNRSQYPGLSPMVFVVPATDFKPGEALVFSAPTDNSGTMGTSVTRPYASTGSQVLAPAPVNSAANPTPYFKATILDIPVNAGDPNDFVTKVKAGGIVGTPVWNWSNGPGGGYDFSMQYHVIGAPYGNYAQMTGQTFLLDASGTSAYQAIDTDPYIRSNMGRWISQSEASAPAYIDLRGTNPVVAPSKWCSLSYRLIWHDEPVQAGPVKSNLLNGNTAWGIGFGGNNSNHNTQYNLFVQNSPRASRHFRNPFDLAIMWRNTHERQFGIWTTDSSAGGPIDYANNQYSPIPSSGRSRGAPFFSSTNASASHVYTLYDLPNATLGVLSLGQLQHVPFAEFSWQPSLALGSGYADPNSPAQATAYGLNSEFGWPVAANLGVAQTQTISGQTADLTPSVGKGSAVAGGTAYLSYAPTALYQKDEITSSAYYIYDLVFELNTAMWDSWFVSGIPYNNTGWNTLAASWDTAATWPNARIVPLGSKQLPAGLPTLYYASASTAVAGAFNVNSTSVRAWTAFLSAQRNLKVNSALGGSDSSGTPFLRNLYPQQGKVQGSVINASFDKNTWGGYRSLTDAEIAQLATAIVAEVRRRGPFLSLADFVNRRLRPVGFDSAQNWKLGDLTKAAYTDPANMGTLQAAVDSAIPDGAASAPDNVDSLNLRANFAANKKPLRSSPNNLTYNGDVNLLQRDNAADFVDAFDTDSKCYHPRGEARVAHRSAGAPGYLMQSDILQQLAPAMTARSDTFTIRAYGQATDTSGGRVLAEAWCEMVVQRMPDPVVPETDSAAAGVNPKSNYTINASGVRTYQRVDLGRRFRILQVRWLRPDEV